MKNIIFIGLIFTILALSGCATQTSSKSLAPCPGFYNLNTSLNHEVLDDQQAFDALKQFWTVYDSQGNLVIGNAIPSDMTVAEALQQNILRKDQTITLSGEGGTVENVWMLYEHRAVDVRGNIYFCDFNVDVGPDLPPQEPGPAVCGDGNCHTEENYESCPEDCPVLPLMA
ncbi:MAG: hypothetical protein ABIJ20_00040 [Nanoarchaeota archaeon]|nr:hypothetical protein [Nanoarchaeota archaeon]MBU1445366.1 hypothetical protein [Nanoarchaeota archaeon]MBU2420139.1 hypothetical protein [Nanoarchaeota archaeon]MBU2475245.1 hypothetical protein [Nanoarchaeota archaeon]